MARFLGVLASILAVTADCQSDCQSEDSSLLSLRANSSQKYDVEGMIQWDKSGNWCLSVDNNDFSSGTKLQIWECVASRGQIFRYYFNSNGGVTIRTADEPYMIKVASQRNGAGLSLTRNDYYGDRWHWGSKYRHGSGGSGLITLSGSYDFCLVIDGNNPFNGAKVQLWKCSDGDSSDKFWKFVPAQAAQAPHSCQAEGGDAYSPDLGQNAKGKCCGSYEPTLCFGNKYLCLANKQCPPCAAEGQDAYDGNIQPNGQCCNGHTSPTLCKNQWFCYDSGSCPTAPAPAWSRNCESQYGGSCGYGRDCCIGLSCKYQSGNRFGTCWDY